LNITTKIKMTHENTASPRKTKNLNKIGTMSNGNRLPL